MQLPFLQTAFARPVGKIIGMNQGPPVRCFGSITWCSCRNAGFELPGLRGGGMHVQVGV